MIYSYSRNNKHPSSFVLSQCEAKPRINSTLLVTRAPSGHHLLEVEPFHGS